jgi:hypothetical protein
MNKFIVTRNVAVTILNNPFHIYFQLLRTLHRLYTLYVLVQVNSQHLSSILGIQRWHVDEINWIIMYTRSVYKRCKVNDKWQYFNCIYFIVIYTANISLYTLIPISVVMYLPHVGIFSNRQNTELVRMNQLVRNMSFWVNGLTSVKWDYGVSGRIWAVTVFKSY